MAGGGVTASSLEKSPAPNTILPPTMVNRDVVSAISASLQEK
jgi:hypothetical protein